MKRRIILLRWLIATLKVGSNRRTARVWSTSIYYYFSGAVIAKTFCFVANFLKAHVWSRGLYRRENPYSR